MAFAAGYECYHTFIHSPYTVKGEEILRRNVLARIIGALDGQVVIDFYIESSNCTNEYPRNVQKNFSQ